MTAMSGWVGAGAVILAAACVSPQPQGGPADSASVAQQPVAAPRDSVLRPPPEPMDRRPWVPNTDSLRITADTARPAPQPSAPPRQAQAPTARPGEWTAGTVSVRREGMRPATLRTVRTGRHAGFDRVVFEFGGDRVPGYHLEYVDSPVRKCGSGDATQVAGQGWLQVRTTPARAHTEAGQATVTHREWKLGMPALKELELTCDFEADVTWVLGVGSPSRYRVQELSNPARLVVDVRH
ncbi:MAG TPA: hypothetical protein VGR37_14600 [Longimicrobiaceae bacterium]|nr:hypothetical protein [Longimicrobiaceae bacterium]